MSQVCFNKLRLKTNQFELLLSLILKLEYYFELRDEDNIVKN